MHCIPLIYFSNNIFFSYTNNSYRIKWLSIMDIFVFHAREYYPNKKKNYSYYQGIFKILINEYSISI